MAHHSRKLARFFDRIGSREFTLGDVVTMAGVDDGTARAALRAWMRAGTLERSASPRNVGHGDIMTSIFRRAGPSGEAVRR